MENLYEKIQEAASFIKSRIDIIPESAIQTGTGLSEIIDETISKIPYSEIPHFPRSTVKSHKGELQLAKLNGKTLLVLSGRFHYYEGYDLKQVTFPIRVLRAIGIQQLIITNVTGGLNADYNAGDIVFVTDHINLLPENPLRGINDERLGIRFPDMKEAYSKRLLAKAKNTCIATGIPYQEGVYVCLQGPSLETKAEYNFLHNIGADMVGMSTVPEVIVAKHIELPITVMSCISNVCYPIEAITETTIDEVIAVAKAASVNMKKLIQGMI